jgi:mono/diheme cytochrome c family protein
MFTSWSIEAAIVRFRVAIALICLGLAGCHLDMYDQPKYKPLSASEFYRDGMSSRTPVEGTVTTGQPENDELLYSGKINGKVADLFPFPISIETARHGQDRFNTFCSPCHGRLGDGNGMIVQRGFPRPPSLLADSVAANPAGFYFDVITNGFGRMYSYAPSVPPQDRWAIVAYIRALQLRQKMKMTALPEDEREKFLRDKK